MLDPSDKARAIGLESEIRDATRRLRVIDFLLMEWSEDGKGVSDDDVCTVRTLVDDALKAACQMEQAFDASSPGNNLRIAS